MFCYGPKPERKRFTTFNQHMFNIGVSLDGDLIAAHPELLDGWTGDEALWGAAPLPMGSRAVAIVVHIYYEETWADIAGVLKRLAIPFDLIVTTVPERERLIETIRRDFPHADIEVMENRGRDVRPFLVLLETGIEVLYWLHESRRDLVRQSPGNDGMTKGTFTIRCR